MDFTPLSNFRHVVGEIDLAKLQSVIRNWSLLLFLFRHNFQIVWRKVEAGVIELKTGFGPRLKTIAQCLGGPVVENNK